MNTVAGSCAVNWFRGSRGKTGCGGARCSFTTKRDSHGSSHYRWEVAYANVNHNSCFGASPISILRRLVIASFSPNWIQTKNFYVVRKGRIPGIYDIWEDCKSQVQGFHDNEYKKFSSGIEAKGYLAAHGINSTRYITKKALLKDPKHGQDAYKNQPEEPLAKATKSKRSRKKLGATESNEELSKASSAIDKPLGNSSKSARSRKEVDAAGSNKVEEPPAKGTKSKRSRKRLDETESYEKFPIASSQQTKLLGNSSKSTRSRKEADAADSNVDLLQASFQPTEPLKKANVLKRTKKKLDEAESNEDLLQAFSQPEEPLVKANRSKRPRKKLDETESNEGLCIVSSRLDKPLSNSSKSGRSRKQVVAADSNEDLLQASSELEEPPAKMIKSKRTRKKLDKTESNKELLGASSSLNQPLGSSSKSTRTKKKAGTEYSDKDSSEVSSLSDPLVNFSKPRRSKKIGVTSSNKDLFQVSKKPLEKITKSKEDGKKLVATDSMKVIYHLEFDGASKGNPGKAGAGALLRSLDGKVVYELREGVGYATNNVAEYRAVILGLKVALSYGISEIHVKGDSKLVCKQIEGLWKTENEDMAKLCGEAKQLKAKFKRFKIRHIERKFNSKADSLANAAVDLGDGEWLSRKFELQGSSDASSLVEPPEKFANSRSSKKSGVVDCNKVCYQMEFDGASKGNPGRAGAGALLRNQDGKVLYKLREGVGLATSNVAEYRAVILGMKVALSQGISRIHVQGDSKLVCMQMQGLWKIKNENMAKLCAEAVRLKTKFKEFYIGHIDREFNSDADALANAAISLQEGELLSSKLDESCVASVNFQT